ncbi:MAG TPA: hypothetical protein K8V47_04355 [Candidatus Amulumruptor caecigallinarius]|uniref:DUF1080 domain-containing protein n=1 Tax=Candidatus Amulumruptor caecigallinarius TaxID=2109911 RepID=A0A921E813_9BACT|nr:hypothetical protein [Candidatus Amulumruptor caecigallinarius]
MKKIFFLTVCCVMAALASNAQLKETFDSNSWQWSEYSTQLGKAYIIDGVMRLESKSDKTDVTYADMVGNVATHAYLPMDPEKGFEIKCVATVEKFEGKKLFGLIMDYIDDMNCLIFMIHDDFAYLYKMKEGNIVGQQRNQFKLQKGKKQTALDINAIYMGGELEIRVNDVQALKCKYVPITSNGFGFFAYGKCKVEFDDVEILN